MANFENTVIQQSGIRLDVTDNLAPPGSLEDCQNIILRKRSTFAPRQGFAIKFSALRSDLQDPHTFTEETLHAVIPFKEGFIIHSDTGLYALQEKTLTQEERLLLTDLIPIDHSFSPNEKLAHTATPHYNGLYYMRRGEFCLYQEEITPPTHSPLASAQVDAPTQKNVAFHRLATWTRPPAPYLQKLLRPDQIEPSDMTPWLQPGKSIATRVAWTRKRTNQTILRSAPSPRMVINNTTSFPTVPIVEITLPYGIQAGDVLELYTSATSSHDSADDELRLLLSQTITEDFLGQNQNTTAGITLTLSGNNRHTLSLYTNASNDGISEANLPPPAASIVSSYKNFMVYGNCTYPPLLTVEIQEGTRFFSGDRIKIEAANGTLIEISALGTQNIGENFVIENSLRDTLANIVYAINRQSNYPNHPFVHAFVYSELTSYKLTSDGSIDGSTDQQNRNYRHTLVFAGTHPQISFSLRFDHTRSEDCSKIFYPDITKLTQATPLKQPHRLFFSKAFLPEAVPEYRFLDIGSDQSKIIAFHEHQNFFYIFKTDGLYQLSGTTYQTFSLRLVQANLFLKGAHTLTSMDNTLYFLSHLGVCSLRYNDIEVISTAIQPLLEERLAWENISLAQIIAVPDRQYLILALPRQQNSTFCDDLFVYHSALNEWTRWTLPVHFFSYWVKENKIIFTDSSHLYIEKRSFAPTDDSDVDLKLNWKNFTLLAKALSSLDFPPLPIQSRLHPEDHEYARLYVEHDLYYTLPDQFAQNRDEISSLLFAHHKPISIPYPVPKHAPFFIDSAPIEATIKENDISGIASSLTLRGNVELYLDNQASTTRENDQLRGLLRFHLQSDLIETKIPKGFLESGSFLFQKIIFSIKNKLPTRTNEQSSMLIAEDHFSNDPYLTQLKETFAFFSGHHQENEFLVFRAELNENDLKTLQKRPSGLSIFVNDPAHPLQIPHEDHFIDSLIFRSRENDNTPTQEPDHTQTTFVSLSTIDHRRLFPQDSIDDPSINQNIASFYQVYIESVTPESMTETKRTQKNSNTTVPIHIIILNPKTNSVFWKNTFLQHAYPISLLSYQILLTEQSSQKIVRNFTNPPDFLENQNFYTFPLTSVSFFEDNPFYKNADFPEVKNNIEIEVLFVADNEDLLQSISLQASETPFSVTYQNPSKLRFITLSGLINLSKDDVSKAAVVTIELKLEKGFYPQAKSSLSFASEPNLHALINNPLYITPIHYRMRDASITQHDSITPSLPMLSPAWEIIASPNTHEQNYFYFLPEDYTLSHLDNQKNPAIEIIRPTNPIINKVHFLGIIIPGNFSHIPIFVGKIAGENFQLAPHPSYPLCTELIFHHEKTNSIQKLYGNFTLFLFAQPIEQGRILESLATIRYGIGTKNQTLRHHLTQMHLEAPITKKAIYHIENLGLPAEPKEIHALHLDFNETTSPSFEIAFQTNNIQPIIWLPISLPQTSFGYGKELHFGQKTWGASTYQRTFKRLSIPRAYRRHLHLKFSWRDRSLHRAFELSSLTAFYRTSSQEIR